MRPNLKVRECRYLAYFLIRLALVSYPTYNRFWEKLALAEK